MIPFVAALKVACDKMDIHESGLVASPRLDGKENRCSDKARQRSKG